MAPQPSLPNCGNASLCLLTLGAQRVMLCWTHSHSFMLGFASWAERAGLQPAKEKPGLLPPYARTTPS